MICEDSGISPEASPTSSREQSGQPPLWGGSPLLRLTFPFWVMFGFGICGVDVFSGVRPELPGAETETRLNNEKREHNKATKLKREAIDRLS